MCGKVALIVARLRHGTTLPPVMGPPGIHRRRPLRLTRELVARPVSGNTEADAVPQRSSIGAALPVPCAAATGY
jgi:hypothetical protein